MTITTGMPAMRVLHPAAGGYQGHIEAFGPLPVTAAPQMALAQVRDSGLRGRGGAWFPTAAKLAAVIENTTGWRTRPTVVANGMEGEPASSKDAVLLHRSPHLVLDGVVHAARIVGAEQAYIALHEGSSAAEPVARALSERPLNDGVEVVLRCLPQRYVASEESAVVAGIDSGRALPTLVKPFESGVGGRPTMVSNVETYANLALIARNGAAAFASTGVPQAPGTTLVTVSGAVVNPGVVEVPTGTPVADILAACGGTTGEIRGYLTGGYGGAWVGPELPAVRWDVTSVAAAGGTVGAGVLLALPTSVCPLVQLAAVSSWLASHSAGQCGPCRFGTSDIAADLGRIASGQFPRSDWTRLQDRLRLIVRRGGCRMPDGLSRFAASGLSLFSAEVGLHLVGQCSVPGGHVAVPVPPAGRHPVAAPKPRKVRR